MSKSPAFQFYAADYLVDEHVQLMTLEQEGVYIRLLAFCWREGSIPADPQLAARLAKNCPVEIIIPVLERFTSHPDRPDRLVHPRLEQEREKQKEWQEKSSAGGKASAAKRNKPKVQLTTVQPKGNQRATKRQPTSNRPVEQWYQPNGNTSSSSSSSSSLVAKDPLLIDHTHSEAAERVCVSKSKFALQQIRQFAWESHQLDQRLISRGQKNVDGIRNPEGWAIAAHRSGEYDDLIQEWIDNPTMFELRNVS